MLALDNLLTSDGAGGSANPSSSDPKSALAPSATAAALQPIDFR
jgi:hypothetical protein